MTTIHHRACLGSVSRVRGSCLILRRSRGASPDREKRPVVPIRRNSSGGSGRLRSGRFRAVGYLRSIQQSPETAPRRQPGNAESTCRASRSRQSTYDVRRRRTASTSSAARGSMLDSGTVTVAIDSPTALKTSSTQPRSPPEGWGTWSTRYATLPARSQCPSTFCRRATRSNICSHITKSLRPTDELGQTPLAPSDPGLTTDLSPFNVATFRERISGWCL